MCKRPPSPLRRFRYDPLRGHAFHSSMLLAKYAATVASATILYNLHACFSLQKSVTTALNTYGAKDTESTELDIVSYEWWTGRLLLMALSLSMQKIPLIAISAFFKLEHVSLTIKDRWWFWESGELYTHYTLVKFVPRCFSYPRTTPHEKSLTPTIRSTPAPFDIDALFLSATSISQVATTSHRTHGHRNICSAKRKQKCHLPRLYSIVPWCFWAIIVVGSFLVVGVLTSKGLTGPEEHDDIGTPCRCRGIAGGKNVEMDWMLLVCMTMLFKWFIYQPLILFVATSVHLCLVNRLVAKMQNEIVEIELANSSRDKKGSKGSFDNAGPPSPMGAKKTSLHLNIIENPLPRSFMSGKLHRRTSTDPNGDPNGVTLVDNPMQGAGPTRSDSKPTMSGKLRRRTSTDPNGDPNGVTLVDNPMQRAGLMSGDSTSTSAANPVGTAAGLDFYKKGSARGGGSNRRKGGVSSTPASLKKGDYMAQFGTKVRHNEAYSMSTS